MLSFLHVFEKQDREVTSALCFFFFKVSKFWILKERELPQKRWRKSFLASSSSDLKFQGCKIYPFLSTHLWFPLIFSLSAFFFLLWSLSILPAFSFFLQLLHFSFLFQELTNINASSISTRLLSNTLMCKNGQTENIYYEQHISFSQNVLKLLFFPLGIM